MFFQPPQSAYNATTTIPAPVGGLNALNSLVDMPETDAIAMENWWPQPYGCSVRKGYKLHVSGLGDRIAYLNEWASPTGARKLFAWTGTNMFDVTVAGILNLPLVTGLTGVNWDVTQVSNASGNNLIAVNGADDAILYNGAVSRISFSATPAPNTWQGLDPKNASLLVTHQSRLWAVQKNSTAAWFLPPDAVFGELKKFDFGPLFSRGGKLQFLATWTIDDGNGAEDHLVGLSSNGEAVVYGGTDPEDDTKWGLVGVYFIGAPVSGNVGFCKAGGDLLILVQQGLISMAAQLVSTKVNEATNPITSRKIQFLISDYITKYAAFPGWDLKYIPRYNMVLINVPVGGSGTVQQLAANQLTTAWTQFSGMQATCWGILDTEPFFGTEDGNIYEAWTGFADNVTPSNPIGTSIQAKIQQAYTYFGKPTTQKQIGMYRPVFTVSTPIAIASAIAYDFEAKNVTFASAAGASAFGRWDAGRWDIARWGGGLQVQKNWIQATGMGFSASLLIASQTDVETLWVATDYSLVNGTGLF